MTRNEAAERLRQIATNGQSVNERIERTVKRYRMASDGPEAAHPTAASTDALRAAVNRMIAAADTDTRYWIENIIAQEGASLVASTDALRAALGRIIAAWDKGPQRYDTDLGPAISEARHRLRAALASSPPPTEGLDVERVAAVLDEAAEKGWNRGDTARVLVARLSSPEGQDR